MRAGAGQRQGQGSGSGKGLEPGAGAGSGPGPGSGTGIREGTRSGPGPGWGLGPGLGAGSEAGPGAPERRPGIAPGAGSGSSPGPVPGPAAPVLPQVSPQDYQNVPIDIQAGKLLGTDRARISDPGSRAGLSRVPARAVPAPPSHQTGEEKGICPGCPQPKSLLSLQIVSLPCCPRVPIARVVSLTPCPHAVPLSPRCPVSLCPRVSHPMSPPCPLSLTRCPLAVPAVPYP